MVLRKRIVARPSARRPLPEPLVTRATCPMSRAAGAFLLSVLLMSPGRSISDPGAVTSCSTGALGVGLRRAVPPAGAQAAASSSSAAAGDGAAVVC
jgi:hypothetical protein